MKKNVLAMSIATMIGGLGFAGIASAETIVATDPAFSAVPAAANNLVLGKAGDKGHILVVPYFTAQDGNMSVFHVVNTDTINGKAVKVRFRGASNSDDILDFQLFMSPGDVWTASVKQGSDGRAKLETADTSCTVPAIPSGGASFVTDRLNPALDDAGKANETREGYVELFTMADIPVPSVLTNSLYATIKHKTNGAAPDCSTTILESATGNLSNITTAATARSIGFDTPTGSLFGDWYIINVAQTTTFSGSATVIRAESAPGVLGRGNFVHFPQSAGAVGTAIANANTADPLFRDAWFDKDYVAGTGSAIEASFYDLPDLSTPYTTLVPLSTTAPLTQAGLLTDSIATTSVSNQYATDASIEAKSDFVFSMPTRRYSVAYDYNESGRDGLRFSKLYDGGVVIADNLQWFNNSVVSVPSGKQICVEAAGQVFYSREEETKSSGAVFSPGQVSKTRLCGETSVLSIGGSVLGATVAKQSVVPNFVNGWLKVNFNGVGLPVQGFAATKLRNPDVGSGVSGTYGITWPHRFVD